MTTALQIAGLVVIGVGVILVLVGTGLAARAEAAIQEDKGFADVIKGLAQLADALAKHTVGVRLVFLGILLILIGGVFCGATALAA